MLEEGNENAFVDLPLFVATLIVNVVSATSRTT